ncbi:putative dihydroorotate dehydrogenase A [Aeropyrum pernix]|uniref:Dihydroorotate dehydrogenase n=1 Tax=Aeropyrum pernix TaxID=56636 RepID=A0A401H7L9_AERPX|nr:dihydroorotate dehydrogenase [Aeropyrum pernix]GBF08370.1 putative dihydroorotate dehydrogenase A [Aeropyrum pernix]
MYSQPELSISIAGLRLQRPVGNASGILGWEPREAKLVEEGGGGFFVAKSVTYQPRKGYPQPHLYPAAGGIVNAVGLANPGFREASNMLAKTVKEASIPVIASIAGGAPGEWVEMASTLEEAGVSAVELNLSCPHFAGGGLELGQDPAAVASVVSAVASTLRIPVIAKLGYSDRLVDAASKALEAGARGLTLINSVRAMKIDVYAKKPVLGNRVGGLSGKPIHPIAVRAVYEVYGETRADIFAAGGVEGWEDAVEFYLAGAKAVQVGAAFIAIGPHVLRSIVEGVRRYLWVEGFRSLQDIVGYAHRA